MHAYRCIKKKIIFVLFTILLSLASAGCLGPGETKNQTPKAILDAEPEVNAGAELNFSAEGSYDNDGKIVLYHWDFGDGESAFGRVVRHVYKKGGNYTVTLTVTDDKGGKGISKYNIHVNELPVAVMRIEKTKAKIDEEVDFRSIGSYDPDGYIREYIWDFGDGTNGSGARCKHAYRNVGEYIVTLTVIDDNGGRASDVKTIEIVLREYNITWKEDMKSIEYSNTTLEGMSNYVEYMADILNITKVVFRLTWSDDIHPFQTENDLFELNATSPDGVTKSSSSMEGKIEITFEITTKPETFKIFARSCEEACKIVGDAFMSELGLGKWLGKVSALECGDGFTQIGFMRDTKNSWELTIECYYYKIVPVEI